MLIKIYWLDLKWTNNGMRLFAREKPSDWMSLLLGTWWWRWRFSSDRKENNEQIVVEEIN